MAVAALLLAMPGAHAPAADARTVTNTATARWSQGDLGFSVSSNTVAFDLVSDDTQIETFVPVSGGGTAIAFNPSICGGSNLAVKGGFSGQQNVATLESASKVHIGQALYFRFILPAANADATKIDRVAVKLKTHSGDHETIMVQETEVNSGVFVGAVPTIPMPSQPVQDDCALNVAGGDQVSIEIQRSDSETPVTTAVDVLADPFGLVFDSEDGSPVNGARVSLVDAASGAPARVFADDGVTPWPSSMISGEAVVDGAGRRWPMEPGEYRFPLAYFGQYRLLVEAPSAWTTPSSAGPAQLAGLKRPDGQPVVVTDASYGGVFSLASAAPVRVDIPADRQVQSLSLTKSASRQVAQPGDVVFYTVTARNTDQSRVRRDVVLSDTASPSLRLRKDSVRIDGVADGGAVTPAADGHSFVVRLGDLAPGAERRVTYAMTVRADANPGQAINRAVLTQQRGEGASAGSVVRIEPDNLAGRMTLIGRIVEGSCDATGPRRGIPGVRVVLEDGSFAITDEDGRYHFDGLLPGSHVAQALSTTLPKGGQFVDCSRSARSAGSASSRFLSGQGGSLVTADFHAVVSQDVASQGYLPNGPEKASPSTEKDLPGNPSGLPLSDKAAAGGETDWLALGDGADGFLFPAVDHNPRAPAVRVVIRHRAGQKVELTVDGKASDPVAYEGVRKSPSGGYAVSIWRGIPLSGEVTRLTAVIRNADGTLAGSYSRDVHFTQVPARVELVTAKSRLVADGKTRPLIALRLTDRHGRPIRAGLAGEFTLNAPYESAEVIDGTQQRALTGVGRTMPRWSVEGDDGMAYVELAPTMASGKLRMEFTFVEGQQRRRQELESWIVPGDQPWTLVGLAEGSVGAKTVADAMERTGRFDSDLGNNGRVAFHAKGRILGRYLLTLSYDSAKQRADQRLLGAIDPNAYYTVFADASSRRFDTASRRKLYVRVEARAFYALFGDFDTGFDQTQLARYQRTTTGVKAELESGRVHVQGFAAKIATTHRRDEFQGGGISGPYRLSSRAILANSESVTLEVRDRFRSEVIVDSRKLERFVDYDIDILSGTITFKQPVLSRDGALNPQFVVVDYEIDGLATGGKANAGLRVDFASADRGLRLGATAITDSNPQPGGEASRTHLGSVDLRARIGAGSEVRAEAAMSRNGGSMAKAWLVEAEHHDGKLDLLAYARSADSDFGLGQTNGAELGRRKLGLDARYSLSESLAMTGSAWHDQSLVDAGHRSAFQLGGQYRSRESEARIGISWMRDRLADGAIARTALLEGSATRRMLDNRLALGAATSIALGKAGAMDLPQRHTFSARYTLTPAVKLLGTYEIAKGEAVNARTARAGLELTPWNGARISSTLGQQSRGEYGRRTFATFGLGQSYNVTSRLLVDATLESNRTLSFDPGALLNPDHPASSGGHLGERGFQAEDFTAATLGATWQADRWTASTRGEWRDGEFANRRGLTLGAIRQLGEGSMVGAGFTVTRANERNGAASRVLEGSISAAHRPATSPFAFLTRIEFRSDRIAGAVAGEAGFAGRSALVVSGDAQSSRVIGSISANWSPKGPLGPQRDASLVQRTEVGVFAAVRHNLDTTEGFDIQGTTLMGGLDARFGIGERFELGAVATVRASLRDGTTSFAVGPQVGFVAAKDTLLVVGYNAKGFRDRDFAEARTTNQGWFATLRMKFDADTFGFLGLGRH